jgi:hypothetical protein
MSFSIEDYEVKRPVLIADKVRIEVVSLELNKMVRLNVFFYKSECFLSVDTIELIGDDYAAWGTDDSYLETYVINKYGLVKKPDPIEIPPPPPLE